MSDRKGGFLDLARSPGFIDVDEDIDANLGIAISWTGDNWSNSGQDYEFFAGGLPRDVHQLWVVPRKPQNLNRYAYRFRLDSVSGPIIVGPLAIVDTGYSQGRMGMPICLPVFVPAGSSIFCQGTSASTMTHRLQLAAIHAPHLRCFRQMTPIGLDSGTTTEFRRNISPTLGTDFTGTPSWAEIGTVPFRTLALTIGVDARGAILSNNDGGAFDLAYSPDGGTTKVQILHHIPIRQYVSSVNEVSPQRFGPFGCDIPDGSKIYVRVYEDTASTLATVYFNAECYGD